MPHPGCCGRVLPFFAVDTSPRLPTDPTLYPRSYRASRGYAIFVNFFSGMIAVGGCLGIWFLATAHAKNPFGAAILIVACLAFVLLGAYNIAATRRYLVTLRSDAIIVQSVFSSRTLFRTEIAGRRNLRTQYVSTLLLVPLTPDQKKLKLALLMQRDEAFEAWLADIPDLDEAEVAESQKQLDADPDLGFSSDRRAQQVANAKKTAITLTALTVVAFFWALFFPRAYIPVVSTLILLPLIALGLLIRSRGIYQVEGRRNDARPSLALVFLFPGIALWVSSMRGLHLLAWKPILPVAILIAIGMTVLIAASDDATRKRPLALVPILLFGVAYGYGFTTEMNVLLDRSRAQTFQVVAFDRHVSHGKSTTYYLDLDPWGPQPVATQVAVPQSLYNATSPGATVCVDLHSGALRIPWYVVGPCS